ncbi:MAG TPA: hypothetical protein PKE16_15820, partial [Hyphomicrobium sp.]|nr:hypothetical protein [Hyphomicrobium sp.]
MTENRQGGEQTAALLDTMQQAMVRLLDRVEAIDLPPPPPRIFESSPSPVYGRTEMFGSDVAREEDLTDEPHTVVFAEDTMGDRFLAEAPPSLPVGSETGMSPEEMALRSEKLRQEFIADARRAKMRLSAEGDDIDAPVSSSRSSYGSSATSSGSRPIRPSTAAAKNTSGPSAPSPLLMIVAAVVLVALAGLWYVFGFEGKLEPPAMRQAGTGTTSQSKDAKASATPQASKPEPSTSEPASQPQSQPQAPSPASGGVNGPRGDAQPGVDSHVSTTTASINEGSEPRTALPMLGVAVDLNRPVTEAELLQARRHQAMANISGELGSAVSRPGESARVPASMVPTAA